MSFQINLYNPELNKKKLTFSALEMAQVLGIALVGLAGITWYLNYQARQQEQAAMARKNLLTVTRNQLDKVNAEYAPRQKSVRIENEIAILEKEVKSLETVAQILKRGDVGNASGYSGYLRAIARQSRPGLWLTHLAIGHAGNDLGLTGRALQAEWVPQYVQRLATEPVLHGKSFSSLEMQRLSDAESGSGNSVPRVNSTPVPVAPPTPASPSRATNGEGTNDPGRLSKNPVLNQLLAPLLKSGSSGPGLVPSAQAAAAQATAQIPAPAPASATPPVAQASPAPGRGTSPVIEFHLQAASKAVPVKGHK